MSTPSCLYLRRGDTFESTELTVGPWRPDAQHGGPPSALLGHLVGEAIDEGWTVARITIELVGRVPIDVLTAATSVQPVSRRVRHVEATLAQPDGRIVATATALALADGNLPEPPWRPSETATQPGPEATVLPPTWAVDQGLAYHRDAIEHRFTHGAFETPGPAADWIRLRCPLIEGEATSPLSRVLAAADVGSGISNVFGPDTGFGLINADLTVAVHRPLEGEWVHLQSTTRVGPQVGHAITILGDERGVIGVASQSLLGTSTASTKVTDAAAPARRTQ